MDFTSLLYGKQHDRESLLKTLDSILDTESCHLTAIPFASEKPLDECFPAQQNNRRFVKVKSGQGVTQYSLTMGWSGRERHSEPVEGNFFIFQHIDLPNIFILLSIEPQEFINRALLPFVMRRFPRIYLTILRQVQLRTLLSQFRKDCGLSELTVQRASLRSRFTKQEDRREAIIPSLSWPRLGLEGAFELAREQNGWFRKLTFKAQAGGNVLARVTITRNGVVRTSRMFRKVFNYLLTPICQMVYESHELFKNRGRRGNTDLKVRPLTIDFHSDILSEKEERLRLVEALRMMPKASVSCVHNNPYLQVSVIDYFDGSTFDLWVVNPTELVIVPQMKGTVPSIRRLVGHIFDNYAEGQVEEFRAVR